MRLGSCEADLGGGGGVKKKKYILRFMMLIG